MTGSEGTVTLNNTSSWILIHDNIITKAYFGQAISKLQELLLVVPPWDPGTAASP